MFQFIKIRNSWIAVSALALAMFAAPVGAHAWTFKVLHIFAGGADDGQYPGGGRLVTDTDGNLYGTTTNGGKHDGGIVFKLAPDGTLTVLHDFACDKTKDGCGPFGGVIRDDAGNLYGTTKWSGQYYYGYGVVFKLAPDGTYSILHTFDGSDGTLPLASLIRDDAGNLYGTTASGGAYGYGVVFGLAPDGTYTDLHDFRADGDGADPLGGVIRDTKGNLYGMTAGGGEYEAGAVFMLAPDGTETILHSFNGSDGRKPDDGPIKDGEGNLYGATFYGGVYDQGVVFKLASDGTETVLHNFKLRFGRSPFGRLLRDRAGNLYGTTEYGSGRCKYGCGTVFELAPDGTFTVLHHFNTTNDGGDYPQAGLVKDSAGNLYGTTSIDPYYGTVFELVK